MEYRKIFGVDFVQTEMNVKDLPIYLTAGRSFYKLSFSGIEFILIKVSEDERFGVIALEKQERLLEEKYCLPVAFGFDHITRSQRDSLLEKNIPFISESGQMYLPFLGMALNSRFTRTKEVNKEKMMPSTQALFLYLLYFSENKPVLKKDAAEAIGVTRTSITRAGDQLEVMGLISQEMHGRECHMITKEKGAALFEKAKPYLINPIQQEITTVIDKKYESFPLSGESALADQTMLNFPGIPVRAVYKARINTEKLSNVDVRWHPDDNVVQLELWKYDPCLYERNGVVDPVSLYMCLENNVDERVEGAIEDYLEGYQW